MGGPAVNKTKSAALVCVDVEVCCERWRMSAFYFGLVWSRVRR